MEKEERIQYTEGQTHELMVRFRGVGLTPEDVQKIIDNKNLAKRIISVVKEAKKTQMSVMVVKLKREYKIHNVVLPVGTPLKVGLAKKSGYACIITCIMFLITDLPDYAWLMTSEISWKDVEHPEFCTFTEGKTGLPFCYGLVDNVVTRSKAKPNFFKSIYCATNDEFMLIHEECHLDLKYCPLCGQRL